MRLPRKVPWANIDELQTLFKWIFGENSDRASREKAIHRLSAWRVATALPNALESTLSILSVSCQDENEKYEMSLVLRQSYSLALIRFVNGLVDPLQSGVFARPIVSIAAQIGIPLWMVELRHAGTHEDLPSLELLREGAKEAMNWLLCNYFLPTLSPYAESGKNLKLTPLSPLLLRYKQISKATTRDVTLKSGSQAEMSKTLRGFDQWLAEASVVASSILYPSSREEEVEGKERWSLLELADRLIDKGGLVPVAKRKRTQPSQRLSGPPAEYVSVWSPLLSHLQSNHPTFLNTLISRILSYLSDHYEISDASLASGISQSDPSYDYTLVSWVLWIIDNYQTNDTAAIDLNVILKEILLGLGYNDNAAAKTLVVELLHRHEKLKDNKSTDILLSHVKTSTGRKTVWSNDALQIMSERLSALRSVDQTQTVSSNVTVVVDHEAQDEMVVDSFNNGIVDSPEETDDIPGWRRLGAADGWKPVPIDFIFIQNLNQISRGQLSEPLEKGLKDDR